MFSKILIANRGEIACRVAATCRRLGIQTVAVYSEADARAAHVAACDAAVAIGPAEAARSYLDAQRILQAARDSGAQAVHPGYGFLSENAAFAEACAAAGLVFIGPPPQAIRAMGLKAESKQLMQAAAVPLVPGYHGAAQDDALLESEAQRIGFPVLIKASAGGGGKGMREVHAAGDFAAALASCRREARASFGNDAVLIEKLVRNPRHIEIQVFADGHGDCVWLFERDCSMQRRHQKVIEEAPAPGLPGAMRRAMGEAAVAAARAVGYVGAGTVEFIVECAEGGAPRQFYFMEMNTRLQVEHPVTEMITGLDLVEWQLRVAAGEPLPLAQDALQARGHAIEARIYAEHPEAGFLPATGRLQRLALPAHVAFAVRANDVAAGPPQGEDGSPRGQRGQGPSAGGVRVDSGVREGDAITPHYDPMIAKLITWGDTREQARARLLQALAQTRIVGLHSNVQFLHRLAACAEFADAAVDTGLIGRRQDTLLAAPALPPALAIAAAAAALLHAEQARQTADPWSRCDGFVPSAAQQRALRFDSPWGELDCVLHYAGAGRPQRLAVPGLVAPAVFAAEVRDCGAGEVAVDLTLGDRRWRAHVVRTADAGFQVFADGEQALLALQSADHGAADEITAGGRLTAPMPGKVIAIHVAAGAAVEAGQPLLVMEAMKMEHTLTAPLAGRVAELLYAVGDLVAEGAELLRLEVPETAGEAASADATGAGA